MADFRRVVTALAVVVLLMGFAQTVSAQPFQCTATAAVPPTLRSEGITELAGDIVLTCSGNPSAAQQTSRFANVQVFFNTGVTSRITASGLSESLLLIDDDVATAQHLEGGDDPDPVARERRIGACEPLWVGNRVAEPGELGQHAEALLVGQTRAARHGQDAEAADRQRVHGGRERSRTARACG